MKVSSEPHIVLKLLGWDAGACECGVCGQGDRWARYPADVSAFEIVPSWVFVRNFVTVGMRCLLCVLTVRNAPVKREQTAQREIFAST